MTSNADISASTPAPPPPAPVLRERVLAASSWAMFGHAAVMLLRLVSNLIMTRLLAPELFGLMAVTISITVIVTLLSDVGIRQAVIQSKRGESREMLATAFTVQFVRGLVIWLVCIGVAVAIDQLARSGMFAPDSVYASPDLMGVIILVTATSVISGLESTKMMLADRSLNLKRVALIEVFALVASITVMVALASVWRNIWPLIAGVWVASLVTLVLSHAWLRGHRDRLGWDPDCAREIANVGRWIFFASALYVLSSNGDRLMLGAWTTQAQLGFYAIALTLAQAVEAALGKLTMSVALPAFSEVVRREPQDLPRVFWKMRLPLDAATLAASGLLFGLGSLVVELLYDDRYREAGRILEILACALFFVRFGVSVSAYIAMGTTRYTTVINFVRMVALFAALPLGYHLWGLDGAYWAIALYQAAMLPLYYVYSRRHGLWSWRREALLLPVWLAAWAAGWAISSLARSSLAG
jgi:O-antigen/teichoic acid export membrane protein